MSVIGTLKKIFSNYNGQTPSTGKEIEDAFNDNFEEVKSAITELESIKIGTESMSLTDPQKSQARSNIGAQAATDTDLDTFNKTITGAINELFETRQGVTDYALHTISKTIVGAINELLNSKIDVNVMDLTDPQKSQARSNIGAQAATDTNLDTFNKSITGAINELFETRQGIIDYSLNTIEKSIVGSINEINNKISTFIFPTAMTLTYPQKITFRNPEIQNIVASIIGSVVKNVLYLKQNPEHTSINVSPAGQIFINKTGISTVTVIPTQNTELFQDINIEVVNPSMRKIGSVIRFSSNNSIRLT